MSAFRCEFMTIPRRLVHPDYTLQHSHHPRPLLSKIATAEHERTKNLKINNRHSAQCYPRLACPLYVSLLMQVHVRTGSSPTPAAHSRNERPKQMQNHAPDACTAKKRGKCGKMA